MMIRSWFDAHVLDDKHRDIRWGEWRYGLQVRTDRYEGEMWEK